MAIQTTEVAPKSREGRANKGAKPGERRGGRQKGVPNKITAELKDMILGALDDAGGQQYLATQAVDNPGPFMTLLGKVLPLQVTGKNGGPLEVSHLSDEALSERISALMAAAHESEQD